MKAVKCTSCGAPQNLLSNNSNCLYCNNILDNEEFDSNLTNEFGLIKFEYINKNYSNALKLAENYLQKDIFNVPCWSYKIASEFLIEVKEKKMVQPPNVKKLENSLKILLEIKIVNSLSQNFLEETITDCIRKKIIPNSEEEFCKYDFQLTHDTTFWDESKSLMSFLSSEFSESFSNKILFYLNKYLNQIFKITSKRAEEYDEWGFKDIGFYSVDRYNVFKLFAFHVKFINDESKQFFDLFFKYEIIFYKYYFNEQQIENYFNELVKKAEALKSYKVDKKIAISWLETHLSLLKYAKYDFIDKHNFIEE